MTLVLRLQKNGSFRRWPVQALKVNGDGLLKQGKCLARSAGRLRPGLVGRRITALPA